MNVENARMTYIVKRRKYMYIKKKSSAAAEYAWQTDSTKDHMRTYTTKVVFSSAQSFDFG